MHKTAILTFLLGLFFRPALFGQKQSYQLQHFTDEHGLPQNSVKFIVPDESGFLWLSTEDGLIRFDGARFRRFSKDNIAVSSNRFQAIYRSRGDRRLFSYTDNYEQVIIDRGMARADPVKNARLLQIEHYVSGNSWVRLYDGVTYLFRPANDAMNKLAIPADDQAMYTYDGDTIRYYSAYRLLKQTSFKTKDDWRFFLLNGRLYLMRESGSATLCSDSVITSPLEGDIREDPLYMRGINHPAPLWNLCVPDHTVLYCNQTFYLASEVRPGLLTTKRLFSGFDAVKNNICAAYYQPATGQLYLGSSTKGFFRLSPQQFRVLSAPEKESIFYSQVVYRKQSIITPQGIVFDLSGKPRLAQLIPQLERDNFYSISTDRQGYVWTKWKEWLYRYAPGTFQPAGKWRLPQNISVMYEGWDGALWIGLRYGGLYLLQRPGAASPPVPVCRFSEDVTYMQQTDASHLYFGTVKGLYRIHISTGAVDSIAGLQGKLIRSIYGPAPDEIWITTYGNGFYLYQNRRLIAFPLDQDRYLATSHCIVEDGKGFFWITTNKGLFQILKSDLLRYAADSSVPLYYHYHDKGEGFRTNEFNGGCQPCAVQLDNGYVSLPSMDGLVVFKPDSLHSQLPDKELFVDEIRLDSKVIGEEALKELPRRLGQLLIHISSPYNGHVKNLQCSYALVGDGYPVVWHPVSPDGVITLSTLPIGDYTLMIRKINGFGPNNFLERRIRLSVAPPWYQMKWFYATCILLLLGCMWLLMRLKVRYTRKRNVYLEQMIALKTGELVRQTAIQGKIIRSVSHDIQTPLHYHKILSGRLYSSLLQEQNTSMVTIAKTLNESAHRLHHMVDNLLNYLKAQMSEQGVGQEEVDLYQLVEGKRMIFGAIAQEKGTDIRNEIPPQLRWQVNGQLLAVILHNILDNAVKITTGGSIIIQARQLQDKLLISIADTGPGISPALQHWINTQPDEPAGQETGPSPKNRSGIGLLIVKELCVLLNIQLSAAAEPGRGTVFTLVAPEPKPGTKDY